MFISAIKFNQLGPLLTLEEVQCLVLPVGVSKVSFP